MRTSIPSHVEFRYIERPKAAASASFPEESEDTLPKHPAVADTVAIGFKSQEWGEAVKAFVVPGPNAAQRR